MCFSYITRNSFISWKWFGSELQQTKDSVSPQILCHPCGERYVWIFSRSIVKIKSGHISAFSTSGTTYHRVDSEFDRELPRMLAPFLRSFDRNLRGCVRNTVSGPNIASLRNKFSTETFHIIRKLLSSEVLSLSRSYLHLLDLMHFQVNSHIIPILSSPLA